MEEYLAKWFIHEMGGSKPVHLKRGCAESDFLHFNLKRLAEGEIPETAWNVKAKEGQVIVPIIIPSFTGLPAATYNVLRPKAKAALVEIIRSRFKVELWTYMERFEHLHVEQKSLLYAWMETNGIPSQYWDSVMKILHRQRDNYRRRLKRRRSKKS